LQKKFEKTLRTKINNSKERSIWVKVHRFIRGKRELMFVIKKNRRETNKNQQNGTKVNGRLTLVQNGEN